MISSQALGFAGTALVIGGYVPQIVHLIRQRCTAGMSLPAFSLWCVASLFFLIHAVMIRDAVFMGVQTVNLIAGALIVGFCKRYEGRVCDYHRNNMPWSTSMTSHARLADRRVRPRADRDRRHACPR
jgi:uncharacterized protein with PQ loop repeat